MTTEEIDKLILDIDTKSANASVKDLRKSIMELKNAMATVEEGSDGFLKLANKAGELKHQVDEISQSINGASADFGDLVGNVSKVSAGIAGGFQAANAALALFGSGSEDVTKAILKLQQSMAIVQGVSQIDNGIKALNKLRSSITATTTAAKLLRAALTPKAILALTAAVTAVIAIFNQFNKKQREAEEAAQQQANTIISNNKRVLESYKNLLNGLGNATKDNIRVVNSLYKVAEDNLDRVLKSESKLSEEQIQLVKKIVKQRQDVYKDLANNTDKYTDEQIDRLTRQLNELNSGWIINVENVSSSVKTAVQEYEKSYSSLINFQEKTEEAVDKTTSSVDKQAESYKLLVAIAKATTDDEIELNRKLLEIEKQRLNDFEEGSIEYYNQLVTIKELEKKLITSNYDDELTLLEQNNVEQITALQLQLYKKEITLEDFNERAKEINDSYKQDYIDTLQFLLSQDELTTEQRLELQRKLNDATKPDENENVNVLSSENAELQSMLIKYSLIEESYGVHLQTMQAKLDEGLRKNLISEETYAKASKKLAREKAQYQINCTAQALNEIANILNSLASTEDQNNKEGFERSKRMQVASATIQMLTGITTAISGAFTTKTGPWDIALAAIQAAAIAAAGGANIANIKKQKYNSDSSDVSSMPSVSSSALSTLSAPVQYTNDINGANIEQSIKNSRVYVVESDITNVQNKVDVTEMENRF